MGSDQIIFHRVWSMPHKNTFEIQPIKEFLEINVNKELLWIDPFSNKSKIAKITNDLNPEYDTNYHMDALDFLKMFEDNSVDGVLFDPPYSVRQVSECYNNVGIEVSNETTRSSFYTDIKIEISRIVKSGGTVISFGWNSGGIGKNLGFQIKEILLVPHGGIHNDTIVTLETKTTMSKNRLF